MYVYRSLLLYLIASQETIVKKANKNSKFPAQRAFSLIEVVVALGIVTFAGFALIGLLGVGLHNTSDSKMQLQAATIMESICSVRRAAATNDLSTVQPGFPLPSLGASAGNITAGTPTWLAWDGSITTASTNARFGFLYNIVAPTNYSSAPTPGNTSTAYICLYWPPQVSPTNANLGHFEVTTTFALP